MKDNPDLRQCATLDACLHWKLHTELTKLVKAKRDHRSTKASGAKAGDGVQLRHKNKVIGVETLVLVGGNDGEMRQWGTGPLGRGNSLVSVTVVTDRSFKPPLFQCHSNTPGDPSWKKEHETFFETFENPKRQEELLIAHSTGRITVQLENAEPHVVPCLLYTSPSPRD